jgi:hypothetical protein
MASGCGLFNLKAAVYFIKLAGSAPIKQPFNGFIFIQKEVQVLVVIY